MGKKKRRIALVGTAESSVHAPYDDPTWEIWGIGVRSAYVTRADRWFELHRLAGKPKDWAANWRGLIRSWSDECELWMLYPEQDLGPKVMSLPCDRITQRFGTFFLTSSFAWMMALAIDEGVDEIGIWGVDMEYGTEYRSQRTGLRHFMALARGLGIHVTHLLSGGVAYEPVPYPLIEDDPLLQKLTLCRDNAAKRLGEWRASLAKTETMVTHNKAVMGEIKDGKRKTSLASETEALSKTALKMQFDIARLEGEDAAQAWFEDYLRP